MAKQLKRNLSNLKHFTLLSAVLVGLTACLDSTLKSTNIKGLEIQPVQISHIEDNKYQAVVPLKNNTSDEICLNPRGEASVHFQEKSLPILNHRLPDDANFVVENDLPWEMIVTRIAPRSVVLLSREIDLEDIFPNAETPRVPNIYEVFKPPFKVSIWVPLVDCSKLSRGQTIVHAKGRSAAHSYAPQPRVYTGQEIEILFRAD